MSRNQGGEQAPVFYKRQPAQPTNQFQFQPRKRPVPPKPNETENNQNTNNISEQVAEGSRADKAGLKLGDSIVNINGTDTSNMTLFEANQVLERGSKHDLKLGITKFDEVDDENPNKTPQVHEVVIEGKNKVKLFEKELQPPRDAFKEIATRKPWHPVMWEQKEFELNENFHQEMPHKRIIRNLRKLLTEVADKPEERAKHIEDLLLALPRGSRRRNDDDE